MLKIKHEVESVVTFKMKHQIMNLKESGMSNRSIATTLGISRNTVTKYVNEAKILWEQIEHTTDKLEILELQKRLVSAPKRKSVRIKKVFKGDLEIRFKELMMQDEQRDLVLGINKQKLSAAMLHRILRSEGFDVGVTTITDEFRKYKNKHRETFIKQSYEPGYRAEYDFHEVKVLIEGRLRKIYQATISLPHSDYIFVKHYYKQDMESFLDSLVTYFEHIGGVPETIVFDNMRNVVRKFIYGGMKTYTDDLMKLASYYGFKIQTTNIRSGNEKGHVEKSGKVARDELFTLNYEFDTLQALSNYVSDTTIKLNVASTPKFMIEKSYLKVLPKARYELGRMTTSKVSHESLISIDTNRYSVPDRYVGETVYVNIYVGLINIYNDQHELVASHKKKVGKDEYSIDILHFTSTFLKKPGALKHSLALKQAPRIIQTLFHKYFTTNIPKFITLIKSLNVYELQELLNQLDSHPTHKYLASNKVSETIEIVSINQLQEISNMHGQGVLSE